MVPSVAIDSSKLCRIMFIWYFPFLFVPQLEMLQSEQQNPQEFLKVLGYSELVVGEELLASKVLISLWYTG